VNNHIDNSLGANYLQRKPMFFGSPISVGDYQQTRDGTHPEIMRPAQCYYITMPKTCVDVMWYMPETHRNPGTIHTFPDMLVEMAGPFTITFIMINMASGDRHSDSMAGLYGCQDTREALKSNGPSPGLRTLPIP
jgi:hypothetical protein